MNAYFDTSAIVPLVVEEPGSELCHGLWMQAETVITVRLMYAELRAALAMARRLGRIEESQHDDAVETVEVLLTQVHHVEVTESLVRHAGGLAHDHALRGYDAVHLAAALLVAGPRTVLVSGDRHLAEVAGRQGMATAVTS